MTLTARARTNAAANGFRRLAANLRKVANNSLVDEVLVQVARQMRAVGRSKLARHKRSGYAEGHTDTRQDSAKVEIYFPRYLAIGANRKWFLFAKGLPRFIVMRAQKLLKDKIKATIKG